MRTSVTVMAVVLLALSGCAGNKTSGAGSNTSAGPAVSLPGTVNDKGTAPAGDRIELELDDFYFKPTYIKTSASQKFAIELKNEGTVAHTFTSTGLSVDEELAPGASKTITVTASAGGAVAFYCRFHQSQGMQGAVVVG